MLKKKNNLGLLITVLICFFLTPNLWSEENQIVITESLQWGYALSLYNSKDYETAVFEFKKFLHFFPESKKTDNARFHLGKALFFSKKYWESAEIFNKIIKHGSKDEMTAESVFYQSRCFRMLGNNGYAELVLLNYLKLTDNLNTVDRIYSEIAAYKLEDAIKMKKDALPEALNYISKISDRNAGIYQKKKYGELIEKALNAPKKKPAVAGGLAVIPGGGFLYCERYQDALVSFLLNTGLMIAAYQAWENDNEALACVLGFVETGFYTGNIYGSVTSAHKYNQAQVLKVLNNALEISPGIDPEHQGISLSFKYKF